MVDGRIGWICLENIYSWMFAPSCELLCVCPTPLTPAWIVSSVKRVLAFVSFELNMFRFYIYRIICNYINSEIIMHFVAIIELYMFATFSVYT